MATLSGNTTNLQAALSAINTLPGVTEIVDIIYPVGTIYTSTNSTNPAELFGVGTWEQVEDVFLLAAGSKHTAGETGGEATHTLTVDEMPSHNHYFEIPEDATARPNVPTWPESTNPGADASDYWHIVWERQGELSDGFYPYTYWIKDISYIGGGLAHNNMPPYLVVYVWKRIS